MSDDNIESRLTDYLDNALSPKERAEIEKYLENNPRQKQILAQLAETRGLLKSLDHAEAPEEILETIQSQLERDQLLGEPIEAPSPSRSRKLMQTFLVAAILVMAVGLAAVIYKMMAPPGERAADVAIATSAPAEESPAPAKMALRSLAATQPHGQDGENVLGYDGHPSPGTQPFVGLRRDNIYTSTDAQTRPSTFFPDATGLPPSLVQKLKVTESSSEVFTNPATQPSSTAADNQPHYLYPANAASVPATTQATSRPATTRAVQGK